MGALSINVVTELAGRPAFSVSVMEAQRAVTLKKVSSFG